MTLGKKFLTLFILMLSILLAIQSWFFYQITDQVSDKVGETAFSVSKDTASIFIYNQDDFYHKQTYTFSKDGHTISKTIVKPNHKNFQIKLGDDNKDAAIHLISQDNQFEIPIPRTPLENSLATLKSRMLWVTLILFALVSAIVAFIIYNLTRPLTALNQTAQKIGQGQLGAQVKLRKKSYAQDVDNTIEQFNQMSDALVELSEQKANQKELKHFRELSDISRGLAHNLRNPLNTLLLSIEQLDSNSKGQTELVQLAHAQVNRIDQWLQNFMLLMEQGLVPERVSSLDLIKQSINQLENEQAKQFIKLNSEQDITINCVTTELAMVIQMLLQNAIDANLNQEPIEVELAEQAEQITITIKDRGTGIDSEIKKKLFTPYVTSKTYGTGMGLFICQRIIQHRYQGDITISDNQPDGTCVQLIVNKSRSSYE